MLNGAVFQIKKWRKKAAAEGSDTAKKQYVSGFTEYSVEHIGVDKARMVGMWAEMDETERAVYEKRAPRKCPHAVDEVRIHDRAFAILSKGLCAVFLGVQYEQHSGRAS